MNHRELLEIVEESVRLKRSFFESRGDEVLRAGEMLSSALSRGDKLLVFGNGGSAADAQHFAAELVNRFRDDRPALPAIALTTDSSILTSVANDTDFRKTFSRQVEALGRSGDVAVAISTSGASPNVLEAVRVARAKGLATLGLAGKDGGELARLTDLCLTVPHPETPRIQEIHSLLIHLFCEMIEDALYPG
ncbi:MAG TPA: D-sedoheptulose 7-phosphate isomerase [Vicinamibacteria bacterium]|nr:D-sedoheptulose 7-phosphate isomerase [Vicinamibacteria bacterium]